MNSLKIGLHSFIDLITNSSTEIFIDYSDSLEPCKEMINEILKTFDINKSCDDIFNISIKNMVPQDIIDAIIEDGCYDENAPWEPDECYPAIISLIPKEEKFKDLGELIIKFLKSGSMKEFLS